MVTFLGAHIASLNHVKTLKKKKKKKKKNQKRKQGEYFLGMLISADIFRGMVDVLLHFFGGVWLIYHVLFWGKTLDAGAKPM